MRIKADSRILIQRKGSAHIYAHGLVWQFMVSARGISRRRNPRRSVSFEKIRYLENYHPIYGVYGVQILLHISIVIQYFSRAPSESKGFDFMVLKNLTVLFTKTVEEQETHQNSSVVMKL